MYSIQSCLKFYHSQGIGRLIRFRDSFGLKKAKIKKNFGLDVSFGSSNRFGVNVFGLTVLYCINQIIIYNRCWWIFEWHKLLRDIFFKSAILTFFTRLHFFNSFWKTVKKKMSLFSTSYHHINILIVSKTNFMSLQKWVI